MAIYQKNYVNGRVHVFLGPLTTANMYDPVGESNADFGKWLKTMLFDIYVDVGVFFLEIISSLYQGRCKSLDPDKGKVGRDRSIFESRYIFCSGTFILLLKLYNFF